MSKVDYRVRRPVTAGMAVTYGGHVTEVDGDHSRVELVERHRDGEIGFEGSATVRRIDRGGR